VSTGPNQLTGTVAGVSHLGDVLQYVVRRPGIDLIARVPRQGGARLAPGDDVLCSWPSEAVYLFSDEQADLVMAERAGEALTSDPLTSPS
jgi:hypothetical protein